MKTCTKCKEEKELAEFSVRRASKDGLNCWCRQCSIANVAKFVKDHAERYRKIQKGSTLKFRYGITVEDWAKMFAKQKGRCAICRKEARRLCVDHDHVTGMVRGLLCHKCNQALGLLEDSVETLRRAARYLRKIRQQPVLHENTVITHTEAPSRWEQWLARRVRSGKRKRRVPAQEQLALALA